MRSPRFHGGGPHRHGMPPRHHGHHGMPPRPPMHHRPPMFGRRPHHRPYRRGCSCLGCMVWVLGAMALLGLLIAAIL